MQPHMHAHSMQKPRSTVYLPRQAWKYRKYRNRAATATGNGIPVSCGFRLSLSVFNLGKPRLDTHSGGSVACSCASAMLIYSTCVQARLQVRGRSHIRWLLSSIRAERWDPRAAHELSKHPATGKDPAAICWHTRRLCSHKSSMRRSLEVLAECLHSHAGFTALTGASSCLQTNIAILVDRLHHSGRSRPS